MTLPLFNPQGAVGPGGSSSNGPHQLADVLDGCERKWGLRYWEQLVPIGEPEHRLVGTLFHTFLAYHYGAMCRVRPAWLDVPLDAELQRLAAGRPGDIRSAKALFDAYVQVAAGRPWMPLAVEEETLFTPADMGWNLEGWEDVAREPFSARVDLEISANGRVWAVDHKTVTPRFGQKLEAWNALGEYTFNWQQLIISLLLQRKYDANFAGVVINRAKRKPPFDFDFHPVTYSPSQLETAKESLLHALRLRLKLKEKVSFGERLRVNPNKCWGRYGACDYFQLCQAATPEARQSVKASMFRTRG